MPVTDRHRLDCIGNFKRITTLSLVPVDIITLSLVPVDIITLSLVPVDI